MLLKKQNKKLDHSLINNRAQLTSDLLLYFLCWIQPILKSSILNIWARYIINIRFQTKSKQNNKKINMLLETKLNTNDFGEQKLDACFTIGHWKQLELKWLHHSQGVLTFFETKVVQRLPLPTLSSLLADILNTCPWGSPGSYLVLFYVPHHISISLVF